MLTSLLITLREGLEAALVIGIIISYLSKINRKDLYINIFTGAALGVIASIAAAVIFSVFAGGFKGQAEVIFEGVVMIIAVIFLTSMILWMNKQGRSIATDIHGRIDTAIGKGQLRGLILITLISVFREGVEIVLFLNASTVVSTGDNSLIGGLLGLLIAAIAALLLYRSALKLNLAKFFKFTGAFIILVAAGMLAGGIHELEEAGIIPVVIEHLWDIKSILDENSMAGSFLKAVFGYNANPSLLEVIAYITYLILSVKIFFAPVQKAADK